MTWLSHNGKKRADKQEILPWFEVGAVKQHDCTMVIRVTLTVKTVADEGGRFKGRRDQRSAVMAGLVHGGDFDSVYFYPGTYCAPPEEERRADLGFRLY